MECTVLRCGAMGGGGWGMGRGSQCLLSLETRSEVLPFKQAHFAYQSQKSSNKHRCPLPKSDGSAARICLDQTSQRDVPQGGTVNATAAFC